MTVELNDRKYRFELCISLFLKSWQNVHRFLPFKPFLSVQFSDTEYIYNVTQLSLPPVERTFPASQSENSVPIYAIVLLFSDPAALCSTFFLMNFPLLDISCITCVCVCVCGLFLLT